MLEEKRAQGEGTVLVAGLAKDFFGAFAAPLAEGSGVGDEFLLPAAGEAVGVFFVVEFPTDRGADVVADDAGERDGVGAVEGAGPETEVDVFTAVDVALVEAAELLPQRAFDEHAGPGEGGDGADGGKETRATRWEGAVVNGFALLIDDDAGVVDGTRAGVELNVADEAGAVGERAVGAEHGFEPAREENEIVIEEGEHVAAGVGDGAVVGGGVTEIAIVEDDAERRAEGGQPGTGVVGAAVVDENDFVREAGGERGLQARNTGAGEREVVEEGYNEAGLHAGTRGARRAPRV